MAIGSELREEGTAFSAVASAQDSRGEIKVKYTSTGRGKQQYTAASEPGLLFRRMDHADGWIQREFTAAGH